MGASTGAALFMGLNFCHLPSPATTRTHRVDLGGGDGGGGAMAETGEMRHFAHFAGASGHFTMSGHFGLLLEDWKARASPMWQVRVPPALRYPESGEFDSHAGAGGTLTTEG